MVLWVSLLGGLALVIATVILIFAMSRAERRARRKLFQALGLTDETIELLMARNGDVLAELALVRLSSPTERDDAAPDALAPAPETSPQRSLPTIRLVHPVTGEARVPGSGREPHSGRHRRL
jgi:hypothetical protein